MMKNFATTFFLVMVLFLSMNSCKKEKEPSDTSLLTSKTWGKPSILHRPGNEGMWNGTTCGEYNNFQNNGVFTWKEECTGFSVEGKWTWTTMGQELFVDYQGALPVINNKRVIILELSDTLLHTYEMSYNVSDTSGGYWEKKYRPREN